MKKIILVISLFAFSQTFCQSKADTEEWIVEKYNEYERVSKYSSTFDLYFESNNMVYEYLNTLFKVKIKDIKKIEIKKERFNNEDDEGWTSIFITFGPGKLLTKKEDELNFVKSESDTFFKIILSSELINDGYKTRMEKALLHLIKLNGGYATIKKAAF